MTSPDKQLKFHIKSETACKEIVWQSEQKTHRGKPVRQHGLQGHCILREKKNRKTHLPANIPWSDISLLTARCVFRLSDTCSDREINNRNPKPNNLNQKFDRQKCRERLQRSWPELISIHISNLKCNTEIQLHKRKQMYQNAQNQVCALKVQTTVAKKQRKTREREREVTYSGKLRRRRSSSSEIWKSGILGDC